MRSHSQPKPSDATRHVAALLLKMVREVGKPTARGVAIQLDVTRQDVATILGLSRIDATVAVNTLKQAGALTFEGSTFLVDPEALECFLSEEENSLDA